MGKSTISMVIFNSYVSHNQILSAVVRPHLPVVRGSKDGQLPIFILCWWLSPRISNSLVMEKQHFAEVNHLAVMIFRCSIAKVFSEHFNKSLQIDLVMMFMDFPWFSVNKYGFSVEISFNVKKFRGELPAKAWSPRQQRPPRKWTAKGPGKAWLRPCQMWLRAAWPPFGKWSFFGIYPLVMSK